MSDIKLSKKAIKTPDMLQQELRKGFQWSTQHSKIVGFVVLAALGAGAAFSGKTWLDQKAENEIQSQYFKIEKSFLEKKAAFAAADEKSKMALLNPKKDAKKDGKKSAENQTPPETATDKVAEKSSGDLLKDYGTMPADFMKIIEKLPKSKAAKMAALNLSDLQIEYKNFDEAKSTLSKVNADSNDLLSALVLIQIGTLQADQKDCGQAVTTWGKVLQNRGAQALYPATKLKQALCYETLNDAPKAEKLYAEIKTENKDSASAKSADKYLRLLQAKK